jgi:hypothetical protein
MTRKLIGLMVLVAMLGACAKLTGPAAGGDTGDNPDSPVSSSPVDPNEPIPSPSPRIVEPRDGLQNPHKRIFDNAITEDPQTIRVEYYMGVEACYGLDHIDVEYGQDVVVITLFEGNVPPGDQACIDLAEFVASIVHLDEPLNGRTIVDGAADAQ